MRPPTEIVAIGMSPLVIGLAPFCFSATAESREQGFRRSLRADCGAQAAARTSGETINKGTVDRCFRSNASGA